MTDSFEQDMKKMWRNFWLAIGAVIVAFVLFVTLVLVPSNNERREICEAKGGVLVGKYGDCIKKEYVL